MSMYLSQGSYMARTRGATCRVESHRLSAPGQNNQGPSWSTKTIYRVEGGKVKSRKADYNRY